MPAERYYVEQTLNSGDTITLKDNEFHHLARVMRTHKGDKVEIINGKGILVEAIVEDILKDRAHLSISTITEQTAPEIRIILAQAIPKPNRLDFILEKGTELGADEFWLFPGKNSLKKDFSPDGIKRLKSQTIVATKQCGRLFLPEIKILPELEKWKEIQGTAFFGDTDPNAPLFSERWNSASLTSPVLFFVGPESGFTDKEIRFFKDRGVQGVKLHPNILRTDTASLLALGLMIR